MKTISSWHVGVAAEAYTAAVFARYGYDVSVQYGANQPEYDLIAVSGDKMLIEDSMHLHPMLRTVWAKDGFGGYTRCRQPQLVCDLIRRESEAALQQDLSAAKCELPKHFDLRISYKEHRNAVRYSFYPGFELLDSHTTHMETDDYFELLRCVPFVF